VKQEKTLKFNLSIHVLKSIKNHFQLKKPMTENLCPRDLMSLTENGPLQKVGQV